MTTADEVGAVDSIALAVKVAVPRANVAVAVGEIVDNEAEEAEAEALLTALLLVTVDTEALLKRL
jgi:hypothetical protein